MQQVNEIFLRTLETHLGVFRQILQTVLNIIIFEECRNQWSMSRPLLGLILLNEEVKMLLFLVFGIIQLFTFFVIIYLLFISPFFLIVL